MDQPRRQSVIVLHQIQLQTTLRNMWSRCGRQGLHQPAVSCAIAEVKTELWSLCRGQAEAGRESACDENRDWYVVLAEKCMLIPCQE